MADPDALDSIRQPLEVCRVHAPIDVDALDTRTRLPGTGGGCPEGARDRAIEVRIVADDRRILATELEDDRLTVLLRQLPDLLSVGDAAGEADLGDRWGAADRGTCLLYTSPSPRDS